MKKLVILILIIFAVFNLRAQSNLNKVVTVNIKQQSLKEALSTIGDEGDFTFSYNSNSIPKDSIVSLYAQNKKVLEVLRTFFNSTYDFKEVGDFVIIRKKAVTTKSVVVVKQGPSNHYFLTGYVRDAENGMPLSNVSIYEKANLLSSMTDENGYFKLKLKKKYKLVSLTIGKEHYVDTSFSIVRLFNQQFDIALEKQTPVELIAEYQNIEAEDVEEESVLAFQALSKTGMRIKDKLVKIGKGSSEKIEEVWTSTKQQLHNLNLKKFYANDNFQISFIPGISNHGRLNSQIENKVSLNVLGGESGGTSLVEIGGLFNLDRRNVQYVQIAGLFNKVGQNVDGVQIAGISNHVADTMRGIQIAGLKNRARIVRGLQIGLINSVEENNGFSLGLINFSKGVNGRRLGFILRVPRKK